MDLSEYDGKHVRITDKWNETPVLYTKISSDFLPYMKYFSMEFCMR